MADGMKNSIGILFAVAIVVVGAFIIASLISTLGNGSGKPNADRSANEKTEPLPAVQAELAGKAKSPPAAGEKTKVAAATKAQNHGGKQSDKPAEAEPQALVDEKTKKLAETKPEQAADAAPGPAAVEELAQLVANKSKRLPPSAYHASQWDPIHFKPEIDKATDAQCLACHSEILSRKVRDAAPAGLKTKDALAWYQTLDTYTGEQQTFHQRHLTSAFARKVMNLKCTFCHQGSDPREEAPGGGVNAPEPGDFPLRKMVNPWEIAPGDFTLRKMVNPSKTCLRCHGKFPYESMGLSGPWHTVRKDLEDEVTKNGCLSCHEETFRTVRHQVNYLKPKEIEKLAKEGTSDVCYGCHGGRAWYNIAYPYPRHPWPGMEDVVEGTPEWAKERPTESDPRFQIDTK